ncbi:MAG: haloacid dehalogenase-like hydrolase [Prevotella sp.]|nr:haloacid dehalogenase-like hydrolase [Prevotella sp.]
MDKSMDGHSNMSMKRQLSVFDFDGTITYGDSFVAFIRHVFGLMPMLAGFMLYAPLIVMMKLRMYPNYKVKEKVFAHFFAGMSIDTFNDHCRRFAHSHGHMLRPAAMQEIDNALAQGNEVVIVSASMINWVGCFFASRPDVKVLSTEIEVKDGLLTGLFSTPNCYGEEKVRRLSDYVTQSDNITQSDNTTHPADIIKRKDCYIIAYGDSKGDKQLLAYADEGHYRPFR